MAAPKPPQRFEGVERRVQTVAVLMTVSFSVLCVQLWQLQVVELRDFQEKAEEQRVWPKRLKSDRGVIYGRHDEMIADNRASADIVLVAGECPKERLEEVCANLERLLGISAEQMLAEVERRRREPFAHLAVKRDVVRADLVCVEEHAYALPGVITVVHPRRRYLHGATAGQLMGYLGEVNREELDSWDGYHLMDMVGKEGVERQYEATLHGKDGYTIVTKYASGNPQFRTDRRGVPYVAKRDTQGHELEEEQGRRVEPQAGGALHLNLDIGLQAHCESLLSGEVGAIVVLDAATGAVFAMASTPGYDPSVFVDRGTPRSRSGLITELLTEGHPKRMRSRAFREVYPPGSVFKVMMAAAALEEGVIDQETTEFCPGFFRLGGKGRPFRCHQRGGHGRVNVVQSLAFSCDVFFYNVGLKLGVDKIAEWSHRMGLGVKTGIDLPGEVRGLVPDRAWKARLHPGEPVWVQRWYPGETVSLSIGQGNAATTPLQCAVMMACAMNGGRRVRPYLRKDLGPEISEPIFSEAVLEIVLEGMRMCVEKREYPAPRGTGRQAYTEGMVVVGKTGSAQTLTREQVGEYENEEDIPWEKRDHAWFVAGVLDREPNIAICAFVERGHHGSTVAAPLAKGVIDYFYAAEAVREQEGAAAPMVARRAAEGRIPRCLNSMFTMRR